MTDSIAVVVAHPDDDVLAFGGTICRHADTGDQVHALYLATGLAARTDSGVADAAMLDALRAEARKAGQILGFKSQEFADLPDNRMDTVPLLEIVKRIEAFVDSVKPMTVYTHHIGDLNVDHSITARAVLTACRPVPGAMVQRIYAGEILSSSEYGLAQDRFRPNTYVGIAPYLERKREALAAYTHEVRYWPHPRSIKAVAMLARLRGSECGLDAAEALALLREVRQ